MSRDLPAEDPLIRMQRDLKRAQKKKPCGHQVGHGHRHRPVHRLPCLHLGVRGGKQAAPGRGVPGGAGGGDRAVSLCAAALYPPALPALPESALRQGLPGDRHLQGRAGGGADELRPLHRLPLLPGGLSLCGPHRRISASGTRPTPRNCPASSMAKRRRPMAMRRTRPRNMARNGPTGMTTLPWAMPASATSACTA